MLFELIGHTSMTFETKGKLKISDKIGSYLYLDRSFENIRHCCSFKKQTNNVHQNGG